MEDSKQTSTCRHCGAEFQPSRSGKGIFCSLKCVGKGGGQQKKPYATYKTDTRGYASWRGSEITDDNAQVYVHRLLAISEFGLEAVAGNIVHHLNGVKWDNRPENIELMSQGQHAARHHSKLSWLDRLRIVELYSDGDITQAELGDEFGVDGSQISRVKTALVGKGET